MMRLGNDALGTINGGTNMYKSKTESGSRGFTLIAALLLMAILSAISIGLLMMVNTEAKVGLHDLQNDMAYRAAEGGMEQLTAQMATAVAQNLNPTPAVFTALNGQSPSSDPTVSYPVYTVTPDLTAGGALNIRAIQIPTGPYAGLNAQIISAALNVTARKNLMNDEVTMNRNVEIALIPVFQFGFFSNGDLSFFASPTLSFNGRIHTNGDLYLGVSNGATLSFNDKITVAGNVVGAVLPNGAAANGGNNDAGPVYILTASDGCASMMPIPPGAPGANCQQFPLNKGSVVGAGGNPLLSGAPNPNLSAQDANWPSTSVNTFGGFITDGNYGNPGGTGAKALTLPFVNGAGNGLNASHQIITRPPQAESPITVLGQSRLGNQAQIRVLLSSTAAEDFLSDSDSPANDPAVPLDNTAYGGAGVAVTGVGSTYFAMATTSTVPIPSWPGGVTITSTDANLIRPTLPAPAPQYPSPAPWPLVGGYVRVEVKETDGFWHGVTQQWLQLGFARGLAVPTAPGTNSVHPHAILIFQEQADRGGNGTISNTPPESTAITGQAAAFNWYPVNLYDAREGEDWDPNLNRTSCTANGVMNAVEIDVGNLKHWLATSATGPLVDSTSQNGYILYFSDRRGMQLLTSGGTTEKNGEYGFEDSINLAGNGTPDGTLEPINPIQPNYSPEDVNGNGQLDNYGVVPVGNAFGVGADTSGGSAGTNLASGTNRNPYKTRFNCYQFGRENAVTGPRHVLKLVDGTITNLPTAPGGTGGFTVASENPVYIQGNYNSDAADTVWTTGNDDPRGHAAAGIIADAVTLLSNNWQDAGTANASVPGSMSVTADSGSNGNQGKDAISTYYRVAIAGGTGMAFSNAAGKDDLFYGTDGGVHNFLRFLENWGANGGNTHGGTQTLYYEGSLVKLYNSVYATGTFKCCVTVYNPPNRHYVFDPDFLTPTGLPPGTPMFRDVESTGYRQDFTPDLTNTN